MTNRTSVGRHRTLCLMGALVGLSITLGACTDSTGEIVTARIPEDYRLRHPIAIQEADRSVVVFVGHARGGLSASQRADVIGLARIWVSERTGCGERIRGNPGAACGGRRASTRNYIASLPS
jgi:pilus assembly protein CpaD